MEQEDDIKDTFAIKQEQEKEQKHDDNQQDKEINGDTPEHEEAKTTKRSQGGTVGSVDVNRGYVLSTFLINLALGQKLGLLRKRSLLLNQQDLEDLSADLSYIIDVKLGV